MPDTTPADDAVAREGDVHEAIRTLEVEAMLLGRYNTSLPQRSRWREDRLDQSAYALLQCLEGSGPLTIKELSQVTGLDSSTLTRQTMPMRTEGLAERLPAASREPHRLRITEKGLEVLASERRTRWAGVVRITKDWPPEDVDRLAELLQRFNRGLEGYIGRSWPRTPPTRTQTSRPPGRTDEPAERPAREEGDKDV